MNPIGIMQGRLSPCTDGKFQSFPKYTWREEFYKARECGLDIIEWIFEADEWEKNPISNDQGIKEIRALVNETGVQVISLCADYFMDLPLLRVDETKALRRLEKLKWLIMQSVKLGIRYINIPFVDNSAITSDREVQQIAAYMKDCAELAKSKSVYLCLETSLNPKNFQKLLEIINNKYYINANYDIGNSAFLGYDVAEEFAYYGDKIKTLHIKDRVFDSGTVPLGTGNADFSKTFKALREYNFSGPIIFQAARGEEGKEIETAKQYLSFMKKYLDMLR